MACLSDSVVSSFTQGLANADEIAEVERHLAECAACRQLVAQMAALGDEPLGRAPEPSEERTELRLVEAAPAPARPTLAPGTVLAGRYRIARFLSRGGMGEVYAAEDGELRETVALKLASAAVPSSEDLVARLKREVLLARRIAHPNVCRIFDVGVHREGGRALVFLTMELLDGPTLAEELQRRGPFPPDEARALVRQLAAGLNAAHERGIVHRDFKLHNVILVRKRREPPRAVIIDFGLARAETAQAMTAAGLVVGTPQYLAPEQLEGRPASARSDVHALGLAWFELVTGQHPFAAATPKEAAARRLREEAPRPGALAPGLPASDEAAILRCLARAPGHRFAGLGQLLEQLDRAPARRLRGPLLVAALIVLAGGGVGLGLRAARSRPPGRPSLALIEAGQLRAGPRPWAETALGELVRDQLEADGAVRAPEAEALADALHASDASLGDAAAAPLPRRLHVEHVALLSVDELAEKPGRLRIALTLDTGSGRERTLASEELAVGELPEAAARLATRLRGELGLRAALERGELGVRAAPERGSEPGPAVAALEQWAEGLRQARRYDEAGAVERWRLALRSQPGTRLEARLLALLAPALERLGYLGPAAEARAQARAGAQLPPSLAEQLALDALEARGAFAELAAAARAQLAAHPDDARVAARLAGSLARLGDCAGAHAVLAERPAPDETARLLDEARLALGCGEWERARRAAEDAARAAREDHAPARASDARRLESAARCALGQAPAARAAAEDALALAGDAGDPVRAIDAQLAAALAASQGGAPAEAQARLTDAYRRATALERGDRAARALAGLAALSRQAGRGDDAQSWLERFAALKLAHAALPTR